MKKKHKTLVIAGGTGFLGQALAHHFKTRYDRIIILTRTARPESGNIYYVEWDAKNPGNWMTYIDGAHTLINLTGRSVECRYNEENKRIILESRIHSTLALGTAIIAAKTAPKVWINSSSATIYAHSEERPNDEINGVIGEDFSMNVCKQWEKTLFQIPTPATRKIALRSSIVLGNEGGAYPRLRTLTKLGLGGAFGNGHQMFSWIHIDDFVRAVHFLIDQESLDGVMNCTAPQPLRNNDLMRLMRQALSVPFGLTHYKWMIEMGAALIGTESELLLKSRFVIPQRLQQAGFTFNYPYFATAINHLTHGNTASHPSPTPVESAF